MPNRDEFLTLKFYMPYALDAVRIVFIFLFAYVFTVLTQRAIKTLGKYSVKMMLKSGAVSPFELEKRAATVSNVIRKSLILLIWTLAVLMALQKLGFEIGPLVASLGVVGIAVGFGAQSLVKDVLGGILLLLENQIRVNDVAVINGTGGLIEEINLRTTVLRAENGAVHIFPNGGIQSLSNLTRDYSYYVFELSLDYAVDPGQVVAELKRIGAEIAGEEAYKDSILAPIEVYGVDRLTSSAMVVKGRLKTLPGHQWTAGRELNRRIKIRFGEVGIGVPFPVYTVQMVNEVT
ncbi:MAG: mechanosensitive ion channel family protein, partial [Bryobacteraceae bacterium]